MTKSWSPAINQDEPFDIMNCYRNTASANCTRLSSQEPDNLLDDSGSRKTENMHALSDTVIEDCSCMPPQESDTIQRASSKKEVKVKQGLKKPAYAQPKPRGCSHRVEDSANSLHEDVVAVQFTQVALVSRLRLGEQQAR